MSTDTRNPLTVGLVFQGVTFPRLVLETDERFVPSQDEEIQLDVSLRPRASWREQRTPKELWVSFDLDVKSKVGRASLTLKVVYVDASSQPISDVTYHQNIDGFMSDEVFSLAVPFLHEGLWSLTSRGFPEPVSLPPNMIRRNLDLKRA